MRKILALALLLSVPAAAAPRSIDECEKIQDPHAYNQCLASFGPTRGGGGARYTAPASEPPAAGAHTAARRTMTMRQRPARMGGLGAVQTGSGRMRMEFTPGRR